MQRKLLSPNGIILAAAVCALASSSQAGSLRTYSTTGTENVRTYNAATGWTESVRSFTAEVDLLTTTEARITKTYPDGSVIVRDLVLHFTVDLNAATQGGTAAELPDPTETVVHRTTYTIGFTSDGLRHSMNASFTARAYLNITGSYQWYNVAYGDLSGSVISPLGNYNLVGSEKSGKTTRGYSGVLTILSDSAALLTKNYNDGSTSTVNLAFATSLDLQATTQTASATQVENSPGQTTSYSLEFSLTAGSFEVACDYFTVSVKGKTIRLVTTGSFAAAQ